MTLRPYAPLAVVGAGLLIVSLAPHAASADDAGAPGSVLVTPDGTDLVVTWEAPSGTGGLTGYEVQVVDPADRSTVLDRTVDPAATRWVLHQADLGGRTDVTVTVGSEYGPTAEPLVAEPVRVSLAAGPDKPEAAPTLRLEGRRLTVQLPSADATGALTGRVVRVFRDGGLWKEVSLQGLKAVFSRRVSAGADYTAAYSRVTSTAQSPFSEQSQPVSVTAATGPGAVRTIKLKAASAGLQVRWSEAAVASADLDSYRVRVLKAGKRVGSAYTASSVRTVLLPGEGADGSAYSVTVTAVDASGGTSTTTATLAPKG